MKINQFSFFRKSCVSQNVCQFVCQEIAQLEYAQDLSRQACALFLGFLRLFPTSHSNSSRANTVMEYYTGWLLGGVAGTGGFRKLFNSKRCCLERFFNRNKCSLWISTREKYYTAINAAVLTLAITLI